MEENKINKKSKIISNNDSKNKYEKMIYYLNKMIKNKDAIYISNKIKYNKFEEDNLNLIISIKTPENTTININNNEEDQNYGDIY